MSFVIGSLAFLLILESVFNGGFGLAVKWLWLPLAALVFGGTWWLREDFRGLGLSRLKIRVMACATYPCLILMSWPYVMALNALTSAGESITYRGPVTRKWISGGRSKGHQIVIMDQATQRPVTLTISSVRYAGLAIGDTYQKTFRIGGLGIPFRWRLPGHAAAAGPSSN